MTAFRARIPVYTKAFSEGAANGKGQPVKTWAAPVTQYVIGIGPEKTAEPIVPGYTRVTLSRRLYVPESFVCGPHDKVVIPATRNLPDVEYDVIGYAEDYCDGPFNFRPGLVVNLYRVEGA